MKLDFDSPSWAKWRGPLHNLAPWLRKLVLAEWLPVQQHLRPLDLLRHHASLDLKISAANRPEEPPQIAPLISGPGH
jgi:hypothetical protein